MNLRKKKQKIYLERLLLDNQRGELTDKEVVDILTDYLLGPNFIAMDTGSREQANYIIVSTIIYKYKQKDKPKYSSTVHINTKEENDEKYL